MSTDLEWAIGLNRFMLKIIGLWPPNNRDKHEIVKPKIRHLYNFIMMLFVLMIPMLMSLIRVWGDMILMVDNLVYSLPMSITVFKVWILWHKQEGNRFLNKMLFYLHLSQTFRSKRARETIQHSAEMFRIHHKHTLKTSRYLQAISTMLSISVAWECIKIDIKAISLCRPIAAGWYGRKRLVEGENERGTGRYAEASQNRSHVHHVRVVHGNMFTDTYLLLSMFRTDDEARDQPNRPRKDIADANVLLVRRVQKSTVRTNVSGANDRAIHREHFLFRGRQLPWTTSFACMRPNGELAVSSGTHGEVYECWCYFGVQRPGSHPLDQVPQTSSQHWWTKQKIERENIADFNTNSKMHFLRWNCYCRSIKIIDDTFHLTLLVLILSFGVTFCLQGFLILSVSDSDNHLQGNTIFLSQTIVNDSHRSLVNRL